MGKVKKERAPKKKRARRWRGRIRSWWRNLSLKAVFMAYMLFFLLAAVGLSAWSLEYFGNVPYDTVKSYLTEAESDEIYNLYIAVSDALVVYGRTQVTQQGDDLRFVETGRETIYLTPEDVRTIGAARVMQTLGLPVSFLGCIVLAGLLFYRNRLKRPIESLSRAYRKVEEGELDFVLKTDRSDELGRLCAGFECMRAALLENNRRTWRAVEERRRFSAALSHDLRTPLTVLRGYAEMLTDGDMPQERVRETGRTMQAQIERMSGYVEGIAGLQRLEDVAVQAEEVDLAWLCAQLERAAEIVCEGVEVRLSGCEGRMALDHTIVMRVFDNLISNAARFAAHRVDVVCICQEDRFTLTVGNDGPPFTGEQFARAAEPYYTGSKEGGHFGLGLSICRVLTSRHGGELTLFNAPDGGAAVRAEFAAQTAPG